MERDALAPAPGVRGGLRAFAAGDALGSPWIGRPPREIRGDRVVPGVPGAATAALVAALHGRTEGSPLVRALVVGWTPSSPAERRAAALELGFEAVIVADLAAWALAGRPLHHLVADHGEDWGPPFRGVGDDPRALLDALLALLLRHDDPGDVIRAAVRLGGATALLAALTGAVLGCRRPAAVERIPWLAELELPAELG